jgi:hypothetical protein
MTRADYSNRLVVKVQEVVTMTAARQDRQDRPDRPDRQDRPDRPDRQDRQDRQEERVRREVTIDAPAEEVWEAVSTEEGRERWLEPDPEREVVVEPATAPGRLVWWWWRQDEPPRRVELLVLPVPAGTRVVVTETAPEFPLAALASAFMPALA